MSKKNKKKIPYNGRDYLMLEIIKGATKANIEKDRRKEKNKKLCRERVRDYD